MDACPKACISVSTVNALTDKPGPTAAPKSPLGTPAAQPSRRHAPTKSTHVHSRTRPRTITKHERERLESRGERLGPSVLPRIALQSPADRSARTPKPRRTTTPLTLRGRPFPACRGHPRWTSRPPVPRQPPGDHFAGGNVRTDADAGAEGIRDALPCARVPSSCSSLAARAPWDVQDRPWTRPGDASHASTKARRDEMDGCTRPGKTGRAACGQPVRPWADPEIDPEGRTGGVLGDNPDAPGRAPV